MASLTCPPPGSHTNLIALSYGGLPLVPMRSGSRLLDIHYECFLTYLRPHASLLFTSFVHLIVYCLLLLPCSTFLLCPILSLRAFLCYGVPLGLPTFCSSCSLLLRCHSFWGDFLVNPDQRFPGDTCTTRPHRTTAIFPPWGVVELIREAAATLGLACSNVVVDERHFYHLRSRRLAWPTRADMAP